MPQYVSKDFTNFSYLGYGIHIFSLISSLLYYIISVYLY